MISQANVEKMFTVNVYGIINMLQVVSRVMGRQPNGGSIVNFVSLTALETKVSLCILQRRAP